MARIGVLSTAHVHTDAYLDLLGGFEGVDLAGVADDDAERGRATADEHGVPFRPADDLLDAADGAVVCSTNADHEAWVERAADAGVDVLCEKPLAPTLAGAERIRDAVADAGVNAGVAMPLRFCDPAREANDALDAGAIGALRSVVGTNRGQFPGGWFADPDAAGGGAVQDHTVHIVDLVGWLTGRRVAEVHAETASRLHDVPVEDVNVLSMELDDGTQFTLDGSWSRPDGFRFWGDATLELLGEAGRIDVDCFDQTLTRTREDTDLVFWGTDPNRGMLEDFVAAVREDRTPETTLAEGRDAVAVVEAAYESAERGEPVAVRYPSNSGR
ncbi:MAG: Gfo/Idh/MocA family protein [Halobacteriaceae archaeon]